VTSQICSRTSPPSHAVHSVGLIRASRGSARAGGANGAKRTMRLIGSAFQISGERERGKQRRDVLLPM
jgi:hypothetical protein